MIKSSLATEIYPAYEGNFTYGRSGRRIEAITIHHMAGKLTARQCGGIFQTPGREGSSHYGIGYNGEIAMLEKKILHGLIQIGIAIVNQLQLKLLMMKMVEIGMYQTHL